MKVIAVNGSPRKKWNTATLLQKTLEGAASQGAETELIHLYDLNYKGCRSCFACKTKEGPSYGRCAAKDGLSPLLQEIESCDSLILGSPIYFGTSSGQMRSFLERLMFPYWTYNDPPQCLFPKPINAGFVYTMNATEEWLKQLGIDRHLRFNERILKMEFGTFESLYCYDTYQFEDYSKIVVDRFDPEKKAKRRQEVFPEDCQRAYDLGVRFARKVV
jgi:multimeric flavodoxin WrbA